MLQLHLWACACPSVCLLSVYLHGACMWVCRWGLILMWRPNPIQVSSCITSVTVNFIALRQCLMSLNLKSAYLASMAGQGILRILPPCLAFYKKFLGFELMSSCFQTSILQPIDWQTCVLSGLPCIFRILVSLASEPFCLFLRQVTL